MATESGKAYFTFSRGINTEASLANWPEGFSIDEENYELQLDGSRRKRLPINPDMAVTIDDDLGAEQAIVVNDPDQQGQASGTFKWGTVSNDSSKNFTIIQLGTSLLIHDDALYATNPTLYEIDLSDFKVTGTGTTTLKNAEVDISFGNGDAFVVGRYVRPFYISYDTTTGEFTTTFIEIKERDFQGYDDGTALTTQPLALSSQHQYNLRNRGWQDADIATFFSGQGTYPSKAMASWLGYRRITTTGVAEADWTKEFSDDKLVAELFQDVSAPQGHFLIPPFTGSIGAGPAIEVDTWTISGTTPGSQTITLDTTSAHGLVATDTFTWSGNSYSFYADYGWYWGGIITGSFDGTYTVATAPSGTQITFTVTLDATFTGFTGWVDQYLGLGDIYAGTEAAPNSTSDRPEATAFWAGRVWYAGMATPGWGDKLYFSQIVESEAQYGKCYQQADPTDERISEVIATDGGVIRIPEIQRVLRLIPYQGALLVFAWNGVWMVAPGDGGVFTPASYSIRKLSDAGLVSKKGVSIADDVPYYASREDIWRIVQDSNQGFLYGQNVTAQTIHSLYTAIPHTNKSYIQAAYNPINKQIWYLYNTSSTGFAFEYNYALVFDTRLMAFTKYTLYTDHDDEYITTVFPLYGVIDKYRVFRFVGYNGANGGLVSTTYLAFESGVAYSDFDGLGDITAYLLTDYNTAAAPFSYKHAPYIWVYSKKTETGYTESGDDLLPVGESSTTLQSRWDWADNAAAGKWGTEQEVYRHLRLYTPSGSSDTFADGVPLLVTKNRVRGRGRALHLRFASEDTTKDSWIAGWFVNTQTNIGK